MFPPNLQKNIQELERQISLLETECEHMEAEKQEATLAGKPNPKAMVRELPNQPFITGPSACVSSYAPPKLLNLQSPIPKMYSASCAHFRTSPEKFPRPTTPKGPEEKRGNRSVTFNESELPERTEETVRGEHISKPTLPVGGFRDEKTNALEKKEPTADQQSTANPDRDNKKPCKRSIDSIKEVSESSEENFTPPVAMCKPKPKNDSKEMPENEQTWCELLREPSPPSKWQERNPNKKNAGVRTCNFSEPKLSSDEECKRELHNGKSKSFSGNWLNELDCQASQGSKLCKRRPRSARTKKNCDEIPMDLNMTKALLEKEIQCMLWSEEREKDEFLSGLNDSIRILQYLIGELKTKLSRERRDDVINDMQNTLMKLSGIKFQKSPLSLTSLQDSSFKIMENEENIFDVKHTLLALKQFCQELSEEKTALTEEVDAKTRAIVSFKSKEKEYLTLISSLKFNLEKMKEEADEGSHARRDLKILRVKLQEETKVIEALKKSHEKMQELVENYVLENDKLKAQVKIAKLESHKFTVLLAGKEAEINKYRKELESFQKQITEQLSLLRSKATENEVEQTIEAISNHPNIIQVEPFRSQMGSGVNFNDNLEDEAIMEPSTTITQQKNSTKHMSPEKVDMNSKQGWEIRSNSTGDGSKPAEEKTRDFPSNEEDEVQPGKRKYGLERVLSSSKNLRSSINELLDDIRRESSDMYWFSQSNSCGTSSQSAMISTSSGEVSEGEQQNN